MSNTTPQRGTGAVTLPCPRVADYETDDDGEAKNACTGIIWRPDAQRHLEPTPGTGGTFTFNCYRDSEGDPGVINGVHYFDVAELTVQFGCLCDLTTKEMTALEERAIEQAKERD